jgi:hypothetical protein
MRDVPDGLRPEFNRLLAEGDSQVQHFPFGSPVVALRQSPLEDARAFVLGVYASAVHAKWLNPDGSMRVGALAVASEPTIQSSQGLICNY